MSKPASGEVTTLFDTKTFDDSASSLFGSEVQVAQSLEDKPVKELTDAECAIEAERLTSISHKAFLDSMSMQANILAGHDISETRTLLDENLDYLAVSKLYDESFTRLKDVRTEQDLRDVSRTYDANIANEITEPLDLLVDNALSDPLDYVELLRHTEEFIAHAMKTDKHFELTEEEFLTSNPRFQYLFEHTVVTVLSAIKVRSEMLNWDKAVLLEALSDLAVWDYVPDSSNRCTRFLTASMVDIGGVFGVETAQKIFPRLLEKTDTYWATENARHQDYEKPWDSSEDDDFGPYELFNAQRMSEQPADYDYDSSLSYSQSQSAEEVYLGDRNYVFDEDMAGMHKTLCEAVRMRAFSSDEVDAASKALVDVLQYESSGTVVFYVRAFEHLGPQAYPALLEGINSPDLLTRKMCENILFDIELGDMRVEEGMVKIYGQMFQLVNDEARSRIVTDIVRARRISPRGDWGAFDEAGRARGLFKLDGEDFRNSTAGPEPIAKQLNMDLQGMIRSVCIPRADETLDRRLEREKVLRSYLDNFSQVVDGFHQDTGVWLNSLELHEQALFIHHITTAASESEVKDIKAIATKYGSIALATYTALEYGESGYELTAFLKSPSVDESFKNRVLDGYFNLTRRAYEWRNVFAAAEVGQNYKFSEELYEAFVRKSSEYFRAAIIVEHEEDDHVKAAKRAELVHSLEQISFALSTLKGLYDDPKSLILEVPRLIKNKRGEWAPARNNPDIQPEYLDADHTVRESEGSIRWVLVNQKNQASVTVLVRPKATQRGEARVNFTVTNQNAEVVRIGIDLSDWGKASGNTEKPYAVSLDLGTGEIDRSGDRIVYPSERVGNILGVVAGSQRGHAEESFSSEAVKNFAGVADALTAHLLNRYPPATSNF